MKKIESHKYFPEINENMMPLHMQYMLCTHCVITSYQISVHALFAVL